jgi:hypothetical protein
MMRSLAALALAASVILAPTVLGQPAPTPTAPQYQVEVLIFGYRDFDGTEERFRSRRPPLPTQQPLRQRPSHDQSFAPFLEDPALPGTPADAVPEPPSAFRVLRPDELQLNAEYRKITNVPTYVPLLHAGWIQPGLPEGQAQPVDLATLGAVNPMGTIRLRLDRFLHVRVDLSYRDSTRPGAEGAAFGDGLSEVELAPRYELATEQQTRSGELRYFDHPAFGVLVKITPVSASPGTGSGSRPAA